VQPLDSFFITKTDDEPGNYDESSIPLRGRREGRNGGDRAL
jgi:hypothetical protein